MMAARWFHQRPGRGRVRDTVRVRRCGCLAGAYHGTTVNTEFGAGAMGTSDIAPGGPGSPASLTRGFLFADLRDYTRFVETHGAAAAAELLIRYRALVRDAVARHSGAEIKTEGDSFYVVFPSVSAGVQCGLAITAACAPGQPGEGIAVGVGIHAGETVETAEGFVGAPVNIAARICGLARPGQVLVSDTVRALTQTMLSVTFTPLGRRPLKGVTEPLMLYVATTADPAAAARAVARRRRSLLLRVAGIGIVVAVLVGAGVWWSTRPAAALPVGDWTIAVQVPLGVDDHVFGDPLVNAVKLAVDDANSSGELGAARLVVDARDEGAADDKTLPLTALNAWVADPRVIALIGPTRSPHARIEIPITNRVGRLECSPTNTNPGLTKPRFGGLDLRSAFPTRINYVRLATVDDIQGPAAASFAYNDLGARRVLVIDDAGDGREVADSFETAFQGLGGTTARRALNPGTTDFSTVLAPLTDSTAGPIGAVYFGGIADEGAPELRAAMRTLGFAAVPLVSWDGLLDGSGSDEGSFIQLAGADAAPAYATTVSIAPVRADFDARFRAAFGAPPDQYAGAANACAQVIIAGLKAVASGGPDASSLGEALRAYVVDPSHRYETVLGSVGFDENGDSVHQFVTFYKVDVGANGGKGDWIILRQQDFGAAP
jgi:branched-chain amino acid transport system substrate-binding protein